MLRRLAFALLFWLTWLGSAFAQYVAPVQMRDANLTTTNTQNLISTLNTFTAPRTLTIPDGSALNAYYIQFADTANAISAIDTLTIQTASGRQINGGSTLVLSAPGAYVFLVPSPTGYFANIVYPSSGSIPSLGTGVATALGVNVGTAGSFVVNGGALGTPSSGSVSNAVLAQMPANTIKCNPTGALANAQDCSGVALAPAQADFSRSFSFAGTSIASANTITTPSENFDLSAGGFSYDFATLHNFGGTSTKGGRTGILGWMRQIAPTAATNPNAFRNYVGIQGIGESVTGDGGTNTGTGALGAIFGGNLQTRVSATATNLLNVSGLEIDMYGASGASMKYNWPLALVSGNVAQGSSLDTALAIYSTAASTSGTTTYGAGVGFGAGITFSEIAATGFPPVSSNATLIGTHLETLASFSAANGVDFRKFNFSGLAFASNNFSVAQNGFITSGTLSQANLHVSGATPTQAISDTSAGVDLKTWDWAPSGGALAGRAVNDAHNAASSWVVVNRTGATATSVIFPTGNMQVGTTGVQASLALTGATSGSTTLIAQAAASGVLTLPAATDTLVGKATTDTLTNKTISGAASISSNGSILSTGPSQGVGYATGAGGAVTQLTSRSTGVTLNNVTGAITLFSAAGSTTATTFTVTNSAVAATDTIVTNQKSGTNLYEIFVTAVAAGSFNVTFLTTGGVAVDAPVFNFSIIKGSAN